jgi:hypothetical protein
MVTIRAAAQTGRGDWTFISWAKAAAAANGVNLASFFGVVVVMNVATDLFGGGGRQAVCDNNSMQPSLLGQEMGHGYGLEHSRVDGSTADYQDPWDIMSTANAFEAADANYGFIGPFLNAANMESQGWLDESRVYDASNVGRAVVQLRPLNRHDLSGYLAVRLSRYFFEFRVQASWDGAIPSPAVLVHRFEDGHSYIMAGNKGQYALLAGDFFEMGDPNARFRPYARVDVEKIDPSSQTATLGLFERPADRIPVEGPAQNFIWSDPRWRRSDHTQWSNHSHSASQSGPRDLGALSCFGGRDTPYISNRAD